MKCSLIDHCLLPANHCLAAANYRLVSANYRLVSANYRLAPANDTILKISVSTTQPYFLNSKLKRKKQWRSDDGQSYHFALAFVVRDE
ncbi:hypothetical protein [Alloprevotella tannerae]|uniref:hypothetical protein n=1 Tax=Alloprevotella tannerae TaxID=76122 RepID=UPI0028EC9561|nr:hypothetical protein [Alloprevotella tannerae]